jgi:hypothetical protein
MADYQAIADHRLEAKVRERYSREVASLEAQGFRYLASCLESQGRFSALWQFPVLLLTLPKKEILVFPPPLRLAVANALLWRNDPPAIALCMGMGVKLYSSFGDGTLLITSTFQSRAVPIPGSSIIKPPGSANIDEAWAAHVASVKNLEESKGAARNLSSFEDYVRLSHQEEDRSQYQ